MVGPGVGSGVGPGMGPGVGQAWVSAYHVPAVFVSAHESSHSRLCWQPPQRHDLVHICLVLLHMDVYMSSDCGGEATERFPTLWMRVGARTTH
jgi:hypothetical protein